MKLDQRHVSPDGELVLLVYHDPKDNDWIVGFEGSEWHTHGDVLAPTFGTTDEAAVDGFVNAVLEDRLVIGAIPIEGRDQLYITKTPEDDVAAQKERASAPSLLVRKGIRRATKIEHVQKLKPTGAKRRRPPA